MGPHAGNKRQLAPFFQFLKHRNNFHVAGAFPGADQGQLPTVIKIHHLRQGFVTAGGRVLNVVAVADTLPEAVKAAYEQAARIHFAGMYMRRDIGRTALELIDDQSAPKGTVPFGAEND